MKFKFQFIMTVLIMFVVSYCQVKSMEDLSNPRKTIETYYRGYITGNKSLTEAARGGEKVSDDGFNPLLIGSYRVDSITTVGKGDRHRYKRGDVKVYVHIFPRDKEFRPYRVVHYLREIEGKWYSMFHWAMLDEDMLNDRDKNWHEEDDYHFLPEAVDSEVDPRLATPEKVIETYYRGKIEGKGSLIELATGGVLSADRFPRKVIVESYRILSRMPVRVTDNAFDMEFIVEEYFINDKYPPLKMYYKTSRIGGNWYIADWYYIPDENYPDVDPESFNEPEG